MRSSLEVALLKNHFHTDTHGPSDLGSGRRSRVERPRAAQLFPRFHEVHGLALPGFCLLCSGDTGLQGKQQCPNLRIWGPLQPHVPDPTLLTLPSRDFRPLRDSNCVLLLVSYLLATPIPALVSFFRCLRGVWPLAQVSPTLCAFIGMASAGPASQAQDPQ